MEDDRCRTTFVNDSVETQVSNHLNEDKLVTVFKLKSTKLEDEFEKLSEGELNEENMKRLEELATTIEEIKLRIQERRLIHLDIISKELTVFAVGKGDSSSFQEEESLDPQHSEKKLKNIIGLPKLEKGKRSVLEVLHFHQNFSNKMANVQPSTDDQKRYLIEAVYSAIKTVLLCLN